MSVLIETVMCGWLEMKVADTILSHGRRVHNTNNMHSCKMFCRSEVMAILVFTN